MIPPKSWPSAPCGIDHLARVVRCPDPGHLDLAGPCIYQHFRHLRAEVVGEVGLPAPRLELPVVLWGVPPALSDQFYTRASSVIDHFLEGDRLLRRADVALALP